jgi:hypothetical protein
LQGFKACSDRQEECKACPVVAVVEAEAAKVTRVVKVEVVVKKMVKAKEEVVAEAETIAEKAFQTRVCSSLLSEVEVVECGLWVVEVFHHQCSSQCRKCHSSQCHRRCTLMMIKVGHRVWSRRCRLSLSCL